MQKTFKRFIATSVLLVNVHFTFAKTGPKYPEGFSPKTTYSILFTENKGQVHDQNDQPRTDVLFGAMAGNMSFHLKTNGVSYQLYKVDKWKEVKEERGVGIKNEIEQQSIYRVDLNWENANNNFRTSQDQLAEGSSNYYLQGCPEGGALNVKSYSGITLHNLYNGINLHYYEKNGQLKHDYIVAAHTNYKQIQLKVEGASVNINKDGSLLLTTPLGQIQEGAPLVYQNGKTLNAKWKVTNNTLSFEIENYNANEELIIDPVTRLWATYYGGSSQDFGSYCATDATGNVYLTGQSSTNTGTIIATSGAHQTVIGGGADAFLVKFNSSGVRQWSTYYGGSGTDNGTSCTSDATGNVYMAGTTNSSAGTVIATAGAHQSTYNSNFDAFLVKFNSNGIRQWGTYYGGSGFDGGYSCACDATGDVYLSGYAASSTGTIIATAGAHQTTHGGSARDAFLVKFNSSGVRQWGTYYGGAGMDEGNSCVSDAAGNIYLAGFTESNTGTIIATAGAHQDTYGGGNYDAYLVKFNPSGIRQWGTYYGGTLEDRGFSCAIDANNNVFLAGWTGSSTGTVIATPGTHQSVFSSNIDAYLVKFNSTGIRQWGTYYGGTGIELGYSCSTDALGNIYLTGITDTNTSTLIATTNQTVYGGSNDAFFAKINSNGIRQWGTYYGGSGNDQGIYCATDAFGNVYLTGSTDSNTGTVIATPVAHQSTNGGVYDAFLVKLTDCAVLNPTTSTNASICLGATINLSVSISGTTTPTYSWTGPNSYTSSMQNPSIVNASTIHIGNYTITLINGICIESKTTQVIVNPLPNISAFSSSTNYICVGASATLTANGAVNYTFNPGGSGSSIVVTPSVTTNYTVTGTDSNGCQNSTIITQSVDPCAGISEIQNASKYLLVFPNPFHSKITLVTNGEKQNIHVYNALGLLVYSTNIENEKTEIDLTKQASGIYFVRMGTVTKKVMKE